MASADKIARVHLRNVRGQLPWLAEVFIDEGEVDMRPAMEVYPDNGFEWAYMVDPTPAIGRGSGGCMGRQVRSGRSRRSWRWCTGEG